LDRVEAANTVLLQQACDGDLAHPLGFCRSWHQGPEFKQPTGGDIAVSCSICDSSAMSWPVKTVGEPHALCRQVLRHARPFPELDHQRIERQEWTKHCGSVLRPSPST
jgi:hypothetical protein